VIETVSGTTDVISGALIASGTFEAVSASTLIVRGGAFYGGATIETASGGTAIVNGFGNNFGTLYASGAGSLIEIETIVPGGTAKIDNGTVEITTSSGEYVDFVTGGSGGLRLDDAAAFTGTISGLGGAGHTNHAQYIDLTNVTYSSGVVSETYSGSTTSGILKVTSGGVTVAKIAMIGSYTSANFHLAAGSGGSGTIITDPSAAPAHSANVGLLGNYIAASFATVAAGNGGTPLGEATQTHSALLTNPHG
jgi:hypothetical protein